jgi:subtilisin family serine protease
MRILKNPVLAASVLGLVLSSCGGTKTMISTPTENIDKMPLKMAALKEQDLQRWSHLDLTKDTVPGMSVDLAYGLLKGKKGKKVVVGVIDSGIDINHEDLKPVIWKNPKEIPGNKIDDDKNGYVDDVNGWNFLGKAVHEQLEMTRIVKKGPGTPDYDKAKAKLEEEQKGVMEQKQQLDFILDAQTTIETHLKKKDFTLDDVKKIDPKTNQKLEQSKKAFMQILAGTSKAEFDKEIIVFKEQVYGQVNYNFNTEYNGRKVVGDNPDSLEDTKYGDNNVIGPEPKSAKHGTHVAGIIAQTRGNKKGGDGVASNNVEIMCLRAVPDGDEYDKDIALAIRYAADNGAKVINGSFGKYFSPQRQWVIDAIKYAASKDVLVIFAAGNDAKDLDKENKYPSDAYDGQAEYADNVLIIGALNVEYGSKMVASFSNYGQNNVDVFAPGMKIYATTPLNTYEYLQGTSMASPNTAGVAALVRSYYPTLTAKQVKQIIMESGTSLGNTVVVGEDKHKAAFKEVSKTGKIVNAYNALLMAEKMTTGK